MLCQSIGVAYRRDAPLEMLQIPQQWYQVERRSLVRLKGLGKAFTVIFFALLCATAHFLTISKDKMKFLYSSYSQRRPNY